MSNRRRKEGIIKERGGEREEQTNALIINLQLSSSVEACASGKRIDAGNNMKRWEERKKKVQECSGGRVASSETLTSDCPAHLCSLSISGACCHRALPEHSWESLAREAKIKISHFRVTTASALREGVNVVSPALCLHVLEPQASKIRLLNNRLKEKHEKVFFFFSEMRDVTVPTWIYLTVQPDPFSDEFSDKW